MNVAIIDDEKLAIDILSIVLESLAEFPICIKGTFTEAMDAFTLFEQERIDLVFLDMEMVDVHGLQVARKLWARYPHMQIIFVTAHAQFALDAFDVEATDYLLKPVHKQRLETAMTKAQKRYELHRERQAEKKEINLYTRVFGSFQLLNAQQETVKWRTRKVKELYLYLWFHQKKPVLNTVIMEQIWPEIDLEKAASNLHSSIYQLRKTLKNNGVDNPILLTNNHYQLILKIDSDYEEFLSILEREQHDDDTIQQLLNGYEDDFLAVEDYPWAKEIQLRLKQSVLYVLESYVAKTEDMNPLLKLNCFQKMLDLDEFNEQYMFLFLQFLIAQNKKQDCRQFYETIQKRLQVELGVPVPNHIDHIYTEYMRKM